MLALSLVFGLFGLVIGSFLNVLILRWGAKSLLGRSSCMSCGTVIPWYDLVPVFSWIFLRGHCRHCKSVISVQYPLVEAGTGVIFALIGAAPIQLSFKVLALPIAALLLAIAVHDLYTTVIPDLWVWTLNALALLSVFLSQYSILHTPYSLLAGPIAAFPLFAMWYVSGGRSMGLGDAKLALSIGWLLGVQGGITTVFLAFILGALVSIPLLFLSSDVFTRFIQLLIPAYAFHNERLGFTMKSEIPFGPFLVASCFLVWFAHMYGLEIALWSIAI